MSWNIWVFYELHIYASSNSRGLCLNAERQNKFHQIWKNTVVIIINPAYEKNKVVTIAQRFKYSVKAFLNTWKSDFPHKGSNEGSHISYLPDGDHAISFGDSIRRGAWVEESEIPLVHWSWNCMVRMRSTGEFRDIKELRKPHMM